MALHMTFEGSLSAERGPKARECILMTILLISKLLLFNHAFSVFSLAYFKGHRQILHATMSMLLA